MAGTKIGGKQAALTNKEEHGEDFYAVIGAKGGRAKTLTKVLVQTEKEQE